ncbi:hypothetical protein [Saccharothrix xinjiangensis]|uniref:NYN domain-containing protein n=1 Tax=Saccharothrix xinjiangensis TaxID=204798 RepID=A0ABV9XZ92_9PSEU
MNADDRVLLLDLENLGTVRLRPRPLRARLETLLAAAGEIHHAVAAYALPTGEDTDPLASLLAELRIAPLRVPPGADGAEVALLAHARHVHTEGGRIFLVGSADGRFVELAGLGRVELLVWEGQPVATRLAERAHHVHRLARPTGTPTEDAGGQHEHEPSDAPIMPAPSAGPVRGEVSVAVRLLTGVATGIGVAVGHRLLDTVLPRRNR